jgi:aspartate racemase
VGLLCTEGTRQSGYYDIRLRQSGLRVVYPDEARQEQIMKAVYAIKRGQLKEARATTLEVATTLATTAVKALLVACTELPIVLDSSSLPLPTLDATLCLAEACVAAATAIQHSRANVSPPQA